MKKYVWAIFLAVAAFPAGSTEAEAFSRGLGSKVRALQDHAYEQRLASAREAYGAGDYARSVKEAQLGLSHASTDEKSVALHRLLANAYQKLGDDTSAAEHLDWLKDRKL